MTRTLYYIAGLLVNPPKNAGELAIQLNYGQDQFPNAGIVSITDFVWVRENYDLLMNYINAGRTNTGVGITEGPAFRVDITDGKTTQTVFDGYFNFKGVKIKDRISITCKAVSHATVDWLNQVASGFTFEYLASLESNLPGAITNNDYVFVPYCLNQIPNYEQAAIATLSIFSISQALYKEAEEITGLSFDAAGVFTTVQAALKMVVKVTYLVTLLAALIKLIEDTIKFIISPVKYHAGMYVRDLMQRACEYLNMKFSSDIWSPSSPYYNEIIIPEKLYNAVSSSDSQLFGFLNPDKNEQVGWYKGTFADLLNALKIKYNAKIFVTTPNGGASSTNQGTVTFLRKDKNALPPQYVLPNLYNPDYTFNNDESNANYLISFQTDTQDINTFQNYQGTLYQVITQQKTTNYQPFVTLTDFVEAAIPFARASTKTGLTVPEQIIEDFAIVFDVIDNIIVGAINDVITAINKITGFINKVVRALKVVRIKLNWNIPTITKLKKSSLEQLIQNRIGMMVLSNDHFTVPKILVIVPGSQPEYTKLHSANDLIESSKGMWDNFHYVNSIVPAQLNPAYADRPYGNQYLVNDFGKIGFTWNDFLKVVANNRVYAPDGTTPAIVESLKFTPPSVNSSGTAEIKVRNSYIYTLNLTETFLNPTGN